MAAPQPVTSTKCVAGQRSRTACGQVPAVLAGAQAEVGDDQLEALVLQAFERLFTRRRDDDVVPALGQHHAGHARQLLFVLHDQDANVALGR